MNGSSGDRVGSPSLGGDSNILQHLAEQHGKDPLLPQPTSVADERRLKTRAQSSNEPQQQFQRQRLQSPKQQVVLLQQQREKQQREQPQQQLKTQLSQQLQLQDADASLEISFKSSSSASSPLVPAGKPKLARRQILYTSRYVAADPNEKKQRRRYKKGGLAERLAKITNRERSEVAFWSHKVRKANGVLSSKVDKLKVCVGFFGLLFFCFLLISSFCQVKYLLCSSILLPFPIQLIPFGSYRFRF